MTSFHVDTEHDQNIKEKQGVKAGNLTEQQQLMYSKLGTNLQVGNLRSSLAIYVYRLRFKDGKLLENV